VRVFSLLVLFLSGLTSCINEYKYCTCKTKDEQLNAYNDVINELVERRFYNFYLGKDEERIFKAYVEKPEDTASMRAEIVRLQNEIYRDTSRFCTLYLDTILKPGFANFNYYETDTGKYNAQFVSILSSISDNKQAVIDTLNQRQTKYSPGDFSLCSSRIVAIENVDNGSSGCVIGKFSLSKLFLNKEKTRGVIYYEFKCGALCGKGELLFIENSNGRWHISKSLRSWIS
jgi:hypothetical protein